MPDDSLVAIVRGDLERVLGITAPPILARVYRWPDAGAQHTVGHLSRVDEIERRLAAHGGLLVAGSGFRAVGIPDCVADARSVAAQAAAASQPRGLIFRASVGWSFYRRNRSSGDFVKKSTRFLLDS